MTNQRAILLLFSAFPLWLLGNNARGEDYAIVVGVNDCPGFRLADGSRPRPLRAAESDADAFAGVLTRECGMPAENIAVLKGPKATRETIRAALASAAQRVRLADVFVFYFAGHGTQVADRLPFDEPDGLDEALCPYDAVDRGDGLIIDDDLGRWIEDIPAGQVTVILDCCHAGTGTKEPNDDLMPRFLPSKAVARKPIAEAPWRELRGTSKAIGRRTASFFACRSDQQAYERRVPGQKPPVSAGQFSHYLLEGFRGKAADVNHDGVVSNRELLDYASRQLDLAFNRDRPTAADCQQPVLEADFPDAPAIGSLPVRIRAPQGE